MTQSQDKGALGRSSLARAAKVCRCPVCSRELGGPWPRAGAPSLAVKECAPELRVPSLGGPGHPGKGPGPEASHPEPRTAQAKMVPSILGPADVASLPSTAPASAPAAGLPAVPPVMVFLIKEPAKDFDKPPEPFSKAPEGVLPEAVDKGLVTAIRPDVKVVEGKIYPQMQEPPSPQRAPPESSSERSGSDATAAPSGQPSPRGSLQSEAASAPSGVLPSPPCGSQDSEPLSLQRTVPSAWRGDEQAAAPTSAMPVAQRAEPSAWRGDEKATGWQPGPDPFRSLVYYTSVRKRQAQQRADLAKAAELQPPERRVGGAGRPALAPEASIRSALCLNIRPRPGA
mmetsp:Transcript_2394/g.5679  ORF Transcript_2394/g.5679 Transcript_2394/m.5679 type:complete len:342 (+) Transcript_2394:34-1059(+)